MTELQDFGSSFGDASAKLPEGYTPPCQWSREILDDTQFFGRWRGWLEAGGTSGLWPSSDLAQYQPIVPPLHCTMPAPPVPAEFIEQ